MLCRFRGVTLTKDQSDAAKANKYLRPKGRSIYSYLNFACAKQVRATATQGELLAPLENPHRLSVPAASRGVIVNIVLMINQDN